MDWKKIDIENLPTGRKLLFLGKLDDWRANFRFCTAKVENIGGKGDGSWNGFILDCGGRVEFYENVLMCDIDIKQEDIDLLPDLPF